MYRFLLVSVIPPNLRWSELLWTDSIHVNQFALGICDVVCLGHQERATCQYGEVLRSGCWCFKKARHRGDRFADPCRFLLSCRWLAREGSHFVKQIPQVENQTFSRKGEMLGFGFLWVGGFVFCIMLFLLGPSICQIWIRSSHSREILQQGNPGLHETRS